MREEKRDFGLGAHLPLDVAPRVLSLGLWDALHTSQSVSTAGWHLCA